jgi:hypothetical protein
VDTKTKTLTVFSIAMAAMVALAIVSITSLTVASAIPEETRDKQFVKTCEKESKFISEGKLKQLQNAGDKVERFEGSGANDCN